MNTIDVTPENFEATIRDGLVLLDWWAPWCGPCRSFGPVFEAAAARHPEARFGKINTEQQPELSSAFEVQSIPTLMVFRDNVLLYARPGALNAAQLEELVTRAQQIDMDAVRREIAEQDAALATGTSPQAGGAR